MDLSIFSQYWKTLTRNSSTRAPQLGHEKGTHEQEDQEPHIVEQITTSYIQDDVQQEQLRDAQDAQEEVNFLSLPAEVRNMIYRCALVEYEIFVDAATSQPALLQVNRQIRQEAISIYYQENYFYWIIYAFDATTHIAWCASSSDRRESKCLWKFRGPRNWNNLLHWLGLFYEGNCQGPFLSQGRPHKAITGKTAATARLFELVRKMRDRHGMVWEDVKAHLLLVHEAFCVLDRKWEFERNAA